jgi:TolA protein
LDSLFHLHQPGFSRFVSVSFILHIVILAIALLLVQGGGQKRIFMAPTYTNVNLIAPAAPKKKAPGKAAKTVKAKKKVAVKKTVVKKKAKPAVKKKTIALKKEVAPPPPVKPVEVEKKISIEDALAKLEKKVAEEEEDLMVAAMIERLAKKTEEEERKKKELLEELRAEIAEYDEASKSVAAETSLQQSSANAYEGLSSEIFDLQFKSYYNKVGAKIQSLWIYSGDADKERLTLITIKINKAGALIDYWIEQKSGDRQFDDSALRAVEKSAPLPPLPKDYNEESIEIGLRFCPGGCINKK